MDQAQLAPIWQLPSGDWCKGQNGYTLLSQAGRAVSPNISADLLAQLLNQPYSATENFPTEFKFHPETGEELQVDPITPVWLAPFGQAQHEKNKMKQTAIGGMQFSQQLYPLKNYPKDSSDQAEFIISTDQLKGSFEFFSIYTGTAIPQLIAINKLKGNIFLLDESTQSWTELTAQQGRLIGCAEALLAYWQAVVFLNQQNQHELYISTQQGVARLRVQALELSYALEYIALGECLSHPMYWQSHIYVLMYIDQQVRLVNVLTGESHAFTDLGEKIYFERAIYDSNYLIWLGQTGQAIIELDIEQQLKLDYKPWLPLRQPDFRFGPPYCDNFGHFYQLCIVEDAMRYVRLASELTVECPSQFRFTTGQVIFSFEDRIQGEIWNISNNAADKQKIMVPLLEDTEQKMILGFRFESDSNEGVLDKLSSDEEQDILLFLASHHHAGWIHRVRVKQPIQSRFFYHRNVLYFYNPNLQQLLGWGAQQ